MLALEIVLGIDNVVFISILVDKLPEERQALAWRLGLGLALVMRILLLSLSWVIELTAPLFTVLGHEISGRNVILGLIAREPPGAEVECSADEQDAARKVEQIQSAFVAQSHGPSKELYGQRLLQCSKPHQEMPGIWRAIGG
jgi:predicted tellurium resistance membrane protein TerC